MLSDLLLAADRRRSVVDDCVALVDDHVATRSGLGGLAIKGAYATVKAIKRGFIRDAVDHLLDEFVAHLEPFFAAAMSAGGDIPAYFSSHSAAIADGLLGVTDNRADVAKNPSLRKAYARLRASAQKHVEPAVPAIARLIVRYVQRPAAATGTS